MCQSVSQATGVFVETQLVSYKGTRSLLPLTLFPPSLAACCSRLPQSDTGVGKDPQDPYKCRLHIVSRKFHLDQTYQQADPDVLYSGCILRYIYMRLKVGTQVAIAIDCKSNRISNRIGSTND